MRWVVDSSLKARGLVFALGAVVLFLGVTQVRNMPVDVLPEFSPPTVEIRTEALGLSAVEVEQLITAPMEQNLLNGVAFLDEIRSESVSGLSSIELIFEPGTELLSARQVVQERLTQAHGALPQVSKPPQMLQPLSSTRRVMMVGLSSQEISPIEQSVLARWTIRPRLMGVPGVANVAIWGQRERQLQVHVDPERLQAAGVSLDQVVETTGNALWVSPLSFLEASTPGTGGFIDTSQQRIGIQHVLPIDSTDDLAAVIVEGCTNTTPSATRHVDANCPTDAPRPPVRLGDVTTVVEGHQPLIGDAVFSDGPGLLLVVEKFPEANTLEVTEGVEDALDGLAPGLSGLEMDPSLYRPATYIEESSDNLREALLIGAILLALVLGILLFDWRAALVAVLAIGLSLVAAALVLHLRGTTMNAMVFAGLVLALVVLVDDAVTDTSAIRQRLRARSGNGDEGAATSAVREAALAVRNPALYGTVVIVLTLLPLLVLRGESGAFFPPLAISYATAVLVSLVVALVATPALSLTLLGSAPLHGRGSPVARWLQRGYDRALPKVVPRWPAAVIAVAVAVVAAIGVLPFLDRGRSLLPSFKDTDLLIRWDGAPGTSLAAMQRITDRAGDELRSLPGVRTVGAHVGRAVTSDQVVGINASEIWVSVHPTADYDETVRSVEEVVDGYPGLDRAVLTYPTERVREVLKRGTDDDLTVRVYGQDLDTLESEAGEVRRALAGIQGVADPSVQRLAEEPTLEVEVDLARAQLAGVKPGDVRRAAAVLLSGVEVGNLFEQQKVFEVVVWGSPETRQDLADVEDLLIDTPTGGHVRLGDIAELRLRPNPTVIRHEDVSRSLDVTADVRGRDVDSVAADVEERLENLQFPPEHHAELLGDYADRQSDRQRFLLVALVAAIGCFLVLQAGFGSWRLAAVVFAALPAALLGGLLAAAIDGSVVSMGTLVGLLAVLGIAARHALLLIARCRRLEDDGEPFGPGVVRVAALERLVPVLLTTAAAGAALAPLLAFGTRVGHELVHPMVVVVLGGLLTSAALNLFAMPSLYLRFGSRVRRAATVEAEVDLTEGNGEVAPTTPGSLRPTYG
jgi:CzcA family heavy metal efflux pump